MKKGQVTLFVILGLVVIAIIAGIAFYKESIYIKLGEMGLVKEAALPPQIENIKQQTQQCIETLSENALFLIGLQGGYIELTSRIKHSTLLVTPEDYDYKGTAYHYYEDKNLVPSTDTMSNELSNYISTNLKGCSKEVEGFDLEYGSRTKIKTKVSDKKIEFNMYWPITIKKEENEYNIGSFKFSTPARLEELRSIVNDIAEQQVESETKEVCLSCLTDISAANDIKIEVQGIEEDTFYMITDEKTETSKGFYTFIMANRF